MKILITIILSLIVTSKVFAIGCTTQQIKKTTISTCTLSLEGKTYKGSGESRSASISFANTQSCTNCRFDILKKIPEKILDKYRNLDNSVTIGTKTLISPSLECNAINAYLFCNNQKFYKFKEKITISSILHQLSQKSHGKVGQVLKRTISCYLNDLKLTCMNKKQYIEVNTREQTRLRNILERILNSSRSAPSKRNGTINKIPEGKRAIPNF